MVFLLRILLTLTSLARTTPFSGTTGLGKDGAHVGVRNFRWFGLRGYQKVRGDGRARMLEAQRTVETGSVFPDRTNLTS